MAASQWLGVALLLALLGGLLFVFLRHGTKVKRDKTDDTGIGPGWSDHGGHSSGDSSGH